MDEFIKLLDKDYELVHYQMKDKAVKGQSTQGRLTFIGKYRLAYEYCYS